MKVKLHIVDDECYSRMTIALSCGTRRTVGQSDFDETEVVGATYPRAIQR